MTTVDAATDHLDRSTFVAAVLAAYRSTPDTPGRTRPADRKLAGELYEDQVPLEVIRAALALATLRRAFRHADADPLEPVHSLHYFKPVVAEILRSPPNPVYLAHVQRRLQERFPAE